MAKVNGKLSGRQQSNQNLVPGGSASQISVEWQGLQQTSYALAAVVNTKLPGNLKRVHQRQIGTLSGRAERYFKESIRRPNEEGQRSWARETGSFTFGARGGGTFVGVIIDEPQQNLYGFGYPNVPKADRDTNFVWRSLEFGLTGARYSSVPSEFGPRGRAQFPSRFTFLPFTGGQGVFHPQGRGSGPKGTLVNPRGRVIRRAVPHPGIAPKLFITRAFESVVADFFRDYEVILGQTFEDFK